MIRVVWLVAVMLVALSGLARGDERDFGAHCFVGSFRACASVSIRLGYGTFGDVPTTFVAVRVSNLQGTPGFKYPGSQGLWQFGIHDLHVDVPPFNQSNFLSGHTEGQAGGFVGQSDHWTPTGSWIWWMDSGVTNPLFGCDQPPQFFEPPYAGTGPNWTCGGASVFESLAIGSTLEFTNNTRIELWWDAYDADGDVTGHGQCVTNQTCMAFVPEPFTIMLAATGLLALAGVGTLRRRKLPYT